MVQPSMYSSNSGMVQHSVQYSMPQPSSNMYGGIPQGIPQSGMPQPSSNVQGGIPQSSFQQGTGKAPIQIIKNSNVSTESHSGTGRIYSIEDYTKYQDYIGGDPSHYVMGMGDYYMQIPIRTANIYTILICAIAVLLIFVFIFFAITRHREVLIVNVNEDIVNNRTAINQPSVTNTQGSTSNGIYDGGYNAKNLVSPMTCNSNNGLWNGAGAVCTCKPPMWGSECQNEAYDETVISSGILNRISANVEITDVPNMPPFTAQALSFTPSRLKGEEPHVLSCTEICETNDDCRGVIYNSATKLCHPYNKVTVHNMKDFHWSDTLESNIYLRKDKLHELPIHITQFVLLYNGKLPLRSQFMNNIISSNRISGGNLKWIRKDVVTAINFYPRFIINRTGMVGVFSTKYFSASEWYDLYLGGNTDEVSINHVPLEWAGRDLWVMYNFLP